MKGKLKVWFIVLISIFIFLLLFCIFYQVNLTINASIIEFNGVQVVQLKSDSNLYFESNQTIQVKINDTLFSVKITSVTKDQNFTYLYLNKWIYNFGSSDRFSIVDKHISFGEFIFTKIF